MTTPGYRNAVFFATKAFLYCGISILPSSAFTFVFHPRGGCHPSGRALPSYDHIHCFSKYIYPPHYYLQLQLFSSPLDLYLFSTSNSFSLFTDCHCHSTDTISTLTSFVYFSSSVGSFFSLFSYLPIRWTIGYLFFHSPAIAKYLDGYQTQRSRYVRMKLSCSLLPPFANNIRLTEMG